MGTPLVRTGRPRHDDAYRPTPERDGSLRSRAADEVITARELMDLMLPILRADFEVFETYQVRAIDLPSAEATESLALLLATNWPGAPADRCASAGPESTQPMARQRPTR
jgi:hypothetical protein